MIEVRYTIVESPIGKLLLAGDEDGLRAIRFETESRGREPDPAWREGSTALREASKQLRQYFAGERREFQIPLAPAGTPFQMRVWNELQKIPYGETISYGELARRIGSPRGSRAVGLANGANPLPIVIPCHRVVGSDGSLTGYGGGLEIKRRLLALEQRQLVLA